MSIFSSLEVGKKSLSAAQLGQTTTGHNIANVDTEGYSRQQIDQSAFKPTNAGVGTGVDVTGIRRSHDIFTQRKLIDEQTLVGQWQTRSGQLDQLEVIFTDVGGLKLRNALNEFWNGWSTVANQPEDSAQRQVLLSSAKRLTERFHSFDRQMDEFRSDLNDKLVAQVGEVNIYAEQIAELNKKIRALKNTSLGANDFKDQRDQLLQKISERISVNWLINGKGDMEIRLGNGHSLVQDISSNPLVTKNDLNEKGKLSTVSIKEGDIDFDITDNLAGGSIAEFVRLRDQVVKGYQNHYNELAKRIAFEVNSLHATGTGIERALKRETNAFPVKAEMLNEPLPDLKNGSLEIQFVDQDFELEDTISIEVEAGKDTLQTIADKINKAGGNVPDENGFFPADPKFKAELNSDGTLTMVSGRGKKFIFSDDETNILPVLGFNSFFNLDKGAGDIEVNSRFLEDEMAFSAGKGLIPGDNQIAQAISDLRFKSVMDDGTYTFNDYYNNQLVDLGNRVNKAKQGRDDHQEMLDQYSMIRDSISSVNLDEEMANMVLYQKAYQSSAKFMSTIDEMTQTLINM